MNIKGNAAYGTIYTYTEDSFKAALLNKFKIKELNIDIVNVVATETGKGISLAESDNGIPCYKAIIR